MLHGTRYPLSEGGSGLENTVMVDDRTRRASCVPRGDDKILREAGRYHFPTVIGGKCELRLLLTVLDPLMHVQKKLESNKVTGSLAKPLIWDLRTSSPDVLYNF